MVKAFDGADRFFPINYQTTWEVVRDGGQGLRPAASTRRRTTRKPSARPRRRRRRRRRRALMLDAAPPVEVVRRRQAGPDRHQRRDRRARHHRDHRRLGHRQEHADPLHQPAGRADGGRDPVRRARISPGCPARRCGCARRHIGMVFQEYNLVERLTVMENLLSGRLGYVSSWRAWRRKFPPDDIRKAFELLDVVGLSGFAQPARRRAVRRPAAARRHRARGDAGAEAAARRRAHVVARSQDVGRDHGAAGRRRARRAAFPVLINMHDVELAKRFADRIVGMSGGRIVFDGAAGVPRPTTC